MVANKRAKYSTEDSLYSHSWSQLVIERSSCLKKFEPEITYGVHSIFTLRKAESVHRGHEQTIDVHSIFTLRFGIR